MPDSTGPEGSEHYHDCPWGSGNKHRCTDPKCRPEDHDEPPLKGEPYHG